MDRYCEHFGRDGLQFYEQRFKGRGPDAEEGEICQKIDAFFNTSSFPG